MQKSEHIKGSRKVIYQSVFFKHKNTDLRAKTWIYLVYTGQRKPERYAYRSGRKVFGISGKISGNFVRNAGVRERHRSSKTEDFFYEQLRNPSFNTSV